MAKEPKFSESAAKTAEKAMPGWKAVSPEQSARVRSLDSGREAPSADAVLPPLAKLRRKYLGEEPATDSVERALDAAAPDDAELVEMESGKLRKTVAVRNGKIVWSQG